MCPNLGSLGKPFLFNISCLLYSHILILDTTHSHTRTHTHGQGDSTFSTFQQKKKALLGKLSFFQEKCWICWILGPPCWIKMCFFLQKCWTCWMFWGKLEGDPGQSIQHIQHFSRKKLYFRINVVLSGEMLNMLNSGAPCWIKMCFFLQKCWTCWICRMFWGAIRRCPSGQRMTHIQHFSWKKHTLGKRSFFQGKCWICWILGPHVESKCASFCSWMFWRELEDRGGGPQDFP